MGKMTRLSLMYSSAGVEGDGGVLERDMKGSTFQTTPSCKLQICHCHIFVTSQRILPLGKV